MNFLKKALNSVQGELKDIKDKGKAAISKIEQKIQKKIGDQPSSGSKLSNEPEVIHVMDRIYWMNFPTNEKIEIVSKYLNTTFGKQYYIWNVSEHKYDVVPFNEQVQDFNVPGYPSPTLQEIFMICKGILSWLDSDPANVAIVHCQNTRGRSALIISCLLCLRNTFHHPGEALTFFCQHTHAKDMSILFPSQHLYLNYFSNIIKGVKLDSKQLKLKKIIFGEVPKIKAEANPQGELFRPYLQIFKDSKIIFNSLSCGKVTAFQEQDLSIVFDLEGTEVTEDILIRCKHYQSNQVRVPVFRMMLHSGFTQNNVQRLLKTEIDFAENIIVSDQFFIDVIFEESSEKNEQENQKKQSNLDYIVEECRRQLTRNNHIDQNPEDDAQKQIQMILESTSLPSTASFESQVFSIGHSDSAEKRKYSYDADEEVDDISTPYEGSYSASSDQQQQSQLISQKQAIQQDQSKELPLQDQSSQQKLPQQTLLQQEEIIAEQKPLENIETKTKEAKLTNLEKVDQILQDSKDTIENLDLGVVESTKNNSDEKKKATQLLLEDKTIEADLDDQEIDDYLDNLGKSDDES